MFRDKILTNRIRNIILFSLCLLIVLGAYRNIRASRADETTNNLEVSKTSVDVEFERRVKADEKSKTPELTQESIVLKYNGENIIDTEKFQLEKLYESTETEKIEETNRTISNSVTNETSNNNSIEDKFIEENYIIEHYKITIYDLGFDIIDQLKLKNNDEEIVLVNQLRKVENETEGNSQFLGLEIERQNVKSIVFVKDRKIAPEETADVSSVQDNSIIAWVKDNIVYIASNDVINLNYDSSYLFSYIGSRTESTTQSIEKDEITTYNLIEGLENIKTYTASNMNYMFKNSGYTDLKEFALDENFDSSNVTTLRGMFENFAYGSLEKLDLGINFNTKNVSDYEGMFNGCGNENLVVSVPQKVYENENSIKFSGNSFKFDNCKFENKYYVDWNIEKINDNLDKSTMIQTLEYKITPLSLNTEIFENTLSMENIKVFVDDEEVPDLLTDFKQVDGGEYFATLSIGEEKKIQSGKIYKEWSGNFEIRIDAGTLKDDKGNENPIDISEKTYVDNIRPTMQGATSSVSKNEEKITFTVTDKNFYQSTISEDDITVLVEATPIDLSKIERTLTAETINEEGIGSVKTVGATYTITLREKETGAIDFNGNVSLAIKSGVAKDYNGNENMASTLTVEMKSINLQDENNNSLDSAPYESIDMSETNAENPKGNTFSGDIPTVPEENVSENNSQIATNTVNVSNVDVNSNQIVSNISTPTGSWKFDNVVANSAEQKITFDLTYTAPNTITSATLTENDLTIFIDGNKVENIGKKIISAGTTGKKTITYKIELSKFENIEEYANVVGTIGVKVKAGVIEYDSY